MDSRRCGTRGEIDRLHPANTNGIPPASFGMWKKSEVDYPRMKPSLPNDLVHRHSSARNNPCISTSDANFPSALHSSRFKAFDQTRRVCEFPADSFVFVWPKSAEATKRFPAISLNIFSLPFQPRSRAYSRRIQISIGFS